MRTLKITLSIIGVIASAHLAYVGKTELAIYIILLSTFILLLPENA